MPKMTDCLISVELANALKAVVKAMKLKVPEGDIRFRCPECRKPVKAHRSRGRNAAHFEHLDKNSTCSLSHKSQGAK